MVVGFTDLVAEYLDIAASISARLAVPVLAAILVSHLSCALSVEYLDITASISCIVPRV